MQVTGAGGPVMIHTAFRAMGLTKYVLIGDRTEHVKINDFRILERGLT